MRKIGKTSMDMRKGSSAENKIYFQSDRMVRVNRGYFFQCRGGTEYGPYPDLRTANIMLARFLKDKANEDAGETAIKQASNTSAYRDQDVVSISEFKDSIDYLETLNQAIEDDLDYFEPLESEVIEGQEVNTDALIDEDARAIEQTSNVEFFRPQANKVKSAPKKADASPTDNLVDIKRASDAKKEKSEPKRFQRSYEVLLDAKAIDEYVLGAEVGTLTILNESSDSPFSFSTTDSRFEIEDRVLKLKPNEYIDYAADAPVTLSITAINKEGLTYEKALDIEITPLFKD